MQVSWIDETDMTALLGRLREPVTPVKVEEEFGDAESLFGEPDISGRLAPAPLPEPASEPVREAPEAEVETHPDLDDFRARLQAIRERAMGAGLLPQPVVQDEPEDTAEPEFEEAGMEESAAINHEESVPVPPPHVPWSLYVPRGNSVMERLESFADWAQPNLRECEFFVIDDQGDMLWGSSTHQPLVQTMVMAWVASSRMNAVFAFNRAPLLRQAMASGGYLVSLPCPTRLGLLHLAITSKQPLSDEYLPDLRYALISAIETVE